MSSGNQFERLWKLQASANKMVLDGKREPEAFADILQGFVFGGNLPDINWREVYWKLGMEAEYKEIVKTFGIKEDSNVWTIPVVKGVTCNKMVDTLRKIDVEVYTCNTNLDAVVTKNDRDPNRDGNYTVSFRRNVEADKDNANKSANSLEKAEHRGITLLERLLLELGYFLVTQEHLDKENITLCTGSCYSFGFVPGVDWHPVSRRVRVRWCDPGYADYDLRSRSAVSPAKAV